MPTSEEIVAFQERHPVKVYGVEGWLRDPYRLGDITVITFYDHQAAIEQTIQECRQVAERLRDHFASTDNDVAATAVQAVIIGIDFLSPADARP